ncbi:MAG TPA: hypothetical protein VFF16_15145, partial [Telluria sp.]|nr:hypothetical protein [Telluria sp.]
AFPAALILVFAWLVLRGRGALPFVFADEWLYSLSSRLQPLAESTLPSYLFLALYKGTSQCGAGFLDCARGLNALWFTASGLFLYLIARRLCTRGVAAVFTLLCLLGPVNSYVLYFMPEAMYFFGFSVLSWLALSGRAWQPWRLALACGTVLGALSQVKVHALFLLPALMLYLAYVGATGAPAGRGRRALLLPLLAAGVAIVVKAALGYALAGAAGLQLLGSFYGSHAANTGSGHLARLLGPAWINLKGHAMALAMLFPVPLAALAWSGGSRAVRASAPPELRDLQVYMVLMLGAALGMTVLYTATLGDGGPVEFMRLHLRYYNFTFPLLLLAGIATIVHGSGAEGRAARAAATALVLVLMALAWKFLLPAYQVSLIDNPELHALAESAARYRNLSALQLIALLVWAWRPAYGVRMLLALVLPLGVIAAAASLQERLKQHRDPGPYDRAGMAVHAFLPQGEAAGLTVGGEGGDIFRALFHIDSAGADFIDLEPNAPLPASEIPPRRRWLLVVGNHSLPASAQVALRGDGYALLRIPQMRGQLRRVEMRAPLAGGVLVAADGLAAAESWGSWSAGRTVRLAFSQPLPRAARLIVHGNAFGPNIGKDFFLDVAGQRVPFRLSWRPQDRVFDLDTDGTARTLEIEVPEPAAPAALGQGTDQRTLGIALNWIEVGSR